MAPHSAQTIDELLADPLVRKVMQADRVDAADLERLLTGAAARIVAGRGRRAPLFDCTRVRFGAEPKRALGEQLFPQLAPFVGCEARLCG